MTRHVGIVACSAEGAALCYRTICAEGEALLGAHAHPEVSMHTPSFARYIACLERGDWPGVGALMLASAEKLATAGADFLICPDNTIHQAFDLIEHRSPRPWLHIAREVAHEAKHNHFHKLAILGTRYLMEGSVYPDALDASAIGHRTPRPEQRAKINQIIFDELVNGEFRPESLAYFVSVIESLKREGCDAVVLGCTEIPLLVTAESSPLPILDSTRLLARAALRKAVAT
jgi:aspartate racemase